MAVTGTFYMNIEDGLIGTKLYGGTAEWDPNLGDTDNVRNLFNLDYVAKTFDWDFQKMPSLQSLIPQALNNISAAEWGTIGNSMNGRNWELIGNSNFYITMATSSYNFPPENNPVGWSSDYVDFWYSLRFNFPGVGANYFVANDFAMGAMGSILGYDTQHTTPSLSYDEYPSRYNANPNAAPTGLLLFWEEVDGVPTPKKLFYVQIRFSTSGTMSFIYRQLSNNLLGYAIMEEEEDMDFPASKLYNMFTTMYAMQPQQVEALAQFLIQKAGDYSGTDKTFMEKLLDDMGFQTGVVTDAIIDMTVYPFDIDNVCDYVETHYLKLGFGSDTVSGTGANLGIFHYPDSVLHKVTWLNTGELAIPPSGSGTVNFDNKVGRLNDFRDYPPYRTFEMYVPYVGIVPVDQRKLYGKNLKLKYIVDFYSGNATCLLLALEGSDWTVIETWDCVMGVHQAVATTNWTEYASRMNSAKSQVVKTGLSLPTSLIKDPMGAVGGVIDATRNQATSEGIYTGNVNGTSSSMGNYFMPQYWYIFDYKQETSITGNLSSLSGRASNTSGAISSFTGFLQVSDVDLVCPKATESEKAKIISLLESGVRI